MPKPTIRIHNAETNEVIDREMTNEEFAAYQASEAELTAEREAIAAKEAQKANLLDRLGITAEEAALLLG